MTPDEFAERFNRLRSSEDRYRYLLRRSALSLQLKLLVGMVLAQ